MPRSSVVSRIAHQSCLEPPAIRPRTGTDDAPWWGQLEHDFRAHQEIFELQASEHVKVGTTAALDTLLKTGAASALLSLAGPSGYNPFTLKAALRDRDFYLPFAESGDPSRFFKSPEALPKMRLEKVRQVMMKTSDGRCEDLVFESPFVPVNPHQRRAYLRHRANRLSRVRLFRHDDGPRATIIAVHGFYADGYSVNAWFFALAYLYSLGFDVALFTLPFHGQRQSRLSPFSGFGFFAGGPSRINECLAHAVFDLRVLVRWLLDVQRAPQVGVTGVSLGGHTTALLATVEPRIHFAVPNVPVASLSDLIFEWEPIGSFMRHVVFPSLSLDIEDARKLLAVCTPLSYRPVLPKSRLMVIGGVGDRLAPPKQARLLWDHWDRCRIHWFPGSHILHLDRGEYLRQLAHFFDDIDFVAEAAA